MKGIREGRYWYKPAMVGLTLVVIAQAAFLYIQSQHYSHDRTVNNAQFDAQQMVIDELDLYRAELGSVIEKFEIETERQNQLLKQYQADIGKFEAEITYFQATLFASQTAQAEAEKRYQQRMNSVISRERRKANDTVARFERERELLELKENELTAKVSEDWEKKRKELEGLYANSAREVENEKRVDALMKQFNQLQVDLGVINVCDKDYLYRYNEAKSLLSHIRTFIQKYEMKEEFYYFVISNESSIIQQNRRLCLTK
ncbi:hypothetical protein [Photobacterium aquae]|uniref:hypothetical protein n=1 Tax=Photobacterium aquae TaxID=1195763 RepID=UPI00069E648F|nr:hypothetical protein [Photobacterium aquae]